MRGTGSASEVICREGKVRRGMPPAARTGRGGGRRAAAAPGGASRPPALAPHVLLAGEGGNAPGGREQGFPENHAGTSFGMRSAGPAGPLERRRTGGIRREGRRLPLPGGLPRRPLGAPQRRARPGARGARGQHGSSRAPPRLRTGNAAGVAARWYCGCAATWR